MLESSVTAAANETSESARQGEEASGGGAPRVNPTDKSTKQTDEKSGDKLKFNKKENESKNNATERKDFEGMNPETGGMLTLNSEKGLIH